MILHDLLGQGTLKGPEGCVPKKGRAVDVVQVALDEFGEGNFVLIGSVSGQ